MVKERLPAVHQQDGVSSEVNRAFARSFAMRCVVAVGSVILMTGVRMLLHPLLGDNVPFLTYFFAVVCSAWYGGFVPGALAVVLSAFVAWYFFFTPFLSFTIQKPTDLPALASFLITGLAICGIGEAQRRAQQRSEQDRQAVTDILESITDGFISLDSEWRFIYVNHEAERINGKSRAELLGKDHWKVFPDLIGTTIEAVFRRAVAEGRPAEFENYYAPWDTWFSVRVFPTREKGLSVYFRDITASKRTEEALRRNEEWLATTLSSIGDAVIATDAEARITFANPVAEQLTGWARDEAIGLPLEEVFCILNEETRQSVESPVARVLATGAIAGLGNHTILVARDGTEHPIDDSASPIRLAEDLLGVVLVFRDITERRLTERELAESLERFRILAEAMPQFVWVSDADGNVEYINRRWTEYSGQTLEQTRERTREVIHPDDAARMFTRWAEARMRGEDYEIEFRCRAVYDDEYRWFLARCVPIKDAEGKIVRWIGTSTDIHTQKQAEEQISLLNERLHRSLYESSHRIKNHLQTLSATVDLVLLEGRTAIPAQEFQRLGMQIRTLSTLQDLLTIEWRTDRSGSVETISSRTLLEKVLTMLQHALPSYTVAYTIEDIPLTLKESTALGLLTNEAVANAVKHGGSEVNISFRRSSTDALLEVCDNGPGFPEGFDPAVSANTGIELIQSLSQDDLHGRTTFTNRRPGACVTVIFTPSSLAAHS